MALALRLSLLLLLAVALHARAAQAALVPARGAGGENDLDYLEDEVLKFFWPPRAEPVADGDQEPGVGPRAEPLEGRVDTPTDEEQLPGEKKSQEAEELLDKMLSELERRRGEGTGNTSTPSTENPLEPSGILAGPPRGKDKASDEKKPQEPSEGMTKTLSELQGGHAMDQEMALWKAAAPEGGTDSLTVSPEGREAMPDPGKQDVVSRAGTQDQTPPSARRVLCPPDYRKRCMIGMMVTMIVVPTILLCCGFVVRTLYRNRELLIKCMMA